MPTKLNPYFIFCILIIVLLGIILRFYKLSENPAGFFADEASINYNAYSIITTGKDEFGSSLPIFFRSFGNFRPGISIYLSIPAIAMLGLNELASRITPAIMGIFTIIVLCLLSYELFKSKLIALFSAFFLAISPWHIHFSRVGMENIYLPLFISLGLLLFIKGYENRKSFLIISSFIIFGLGLYTYVPAYFFIPLVVSIMIFIYLKKIIEHRKYSLIGLFIFGLFLIPLLIGIKTGKTFARLNDLNSTQINRPIVITINKMVTTYFDHFSLSFLFSKGDIGMPNHFITRFSVKGMGELYWFQLPLIVLGLLFCYAYNKKVFLIIISLLIVYPLGSTLVPFSDGGGPFATRSIIGVIPFQILSACGVIYCLNFTKNKTVKYFIVLTLIILIILSLNNYLYKYFVQYPLYSSDFWGWQYGAREIINYFVQNQSKYDELIMAPEFNAPEIFFKFYSPNDCFKCKVGLPNTSYRPELKQLFAITPEYLNKNSNMQLHVYKVINYPGKNEAAFIIGSIILNTNKISKKI